MPATSTTTPPATDDKPAYSPGLEGVIAGETELSFVNPELKSLMYRGYDIRELAENASFEEAAFLMLNGHLPTASELETFNNTLIEARTLSQPIIEGLKSFPAKLPNGDAIHPMDKLRTATALLALYDPETNDGSHDANVRKATRMLGAFPSIVAANHRFKSGEDLIAPNNELGHAANFLYMLNGEAPDPDTARLFEITLIAYIDHGFNASTFASRVTTSTLSDIHSGIVSAIGTLKGSLHGGANEEAMKMLLEIDQPEKAEAFILDAIKNKRKIMGFGHRAYKNGDPRAFLLTDKAKDLCERTDNMRWYEIARIAQETMIREKNIFPNVDFPTAYIYYVMGLPIDIYTPLFAIARVAGWSSHVIEQLDHNRLIRPKAIYTGPDHNEYVPIEQR